MSRFIYREVWDDTVKSSVKRSALNDSDVRFPRAK